MSLLQVRKGKIISPEFNLKEKWPPSLNFPININDNCQNLWKWLSTEMTSPKCKKCMLYFKEKCQILHSSPSNKYEGNIFSISARETQYYTRQHKWSYIFSHPAFFYPKLCKAPSVNSMQQHQFQMFCKLYSVTKQTSTIGF